LQGLGLQLSDVLKPLARFPMPLQFFRVANLYWYSNISVKCFSVGLLESITKY